MSLVGGHIGPPTAENIRNTRSRRPNMPLPYDFVWRLHDFFTHLLQFLSGTFA
ncbi:hypothetical protein Pla111_07390 [Botrimarina hoheduenensis]|uniref:Uncharacterized protein n=2 Tax=Botrimarina hoheduenensis TaxID=2528000 RepID=A0A5C5WFS7_9BACT|nr:hypothetical protein Pla111_07390 [Botrimarina hoheduenensis]